MPSSRRRFLASIATVGAGLAGCLGPSTGDGTGSATPTTTRSPTATTATATLGDSRTHSGMTVTVSDLVPASSVRYLTAPDAFGVAAAGDGRFVFVDVTVGGDGPPPSADAFGFVADGTRTDPGIDAVGPSRMAGPVDGRQYDDGDGVLSFRVPAPLDATDLAVVLDDGSDAVRWAVPPSVAEPLRRPSPSFAVTVDVPSSVPVDEAVPVRLHVENDGDGAGVFRGAINHQGPLYGASPIDVPLQAGESTTHETLVDYYHRADVPPSRVQFSVIGPDFSDSFEVRLDGGGTPNGTGTGTGTGTETGTETHTNP